MLSSTISSYSVVFSTSFPKRMVVPTLFCVALFLRNDFRSEINLQRTKKVTTQKVKNSLNALCITSFPTVTNQLHDSGLKRAC